MSDSDKKVIACLDNMTLEQARRELAWGTFGSPGSPNHDFASQWLAVKEAEERDKRDAETLDIAKDANRIASNALSEAERANRSRWKDRTMTIIAIIIAMIAARKEIMWLISWLTNIFKTS
jgi:hypothetical protein